MSEHYTEKDYENIKEILKYPEALENRLDFFDNTSGINIPEDPIEKVVFQDKAKAAIRKISQNKGHILMVGKPGTGKSMLANMFNEVIEKTFGEYIRPSEVIVAYSGKDQNHMRVAYEDPEHIDSLIDRLNNDVASAMNNVESFNLSAQIKSVKKVKKGLLVSAVVSVIIGIFFPPAFIVTSLTGIGAIFMYLQENNHKAQEKIQRENNAGKKNAVKPIIDMMPEVLYDPRKEKNLMARVSEPSARNMKGGFRHDPYQSGSLGTPIHKRAYLGAHAKAPIIYIDEMKSLIKAGYMSEMLEIMQNKKYVLEGGKDTGSGAADQSEDPLIADNIIIACCNHDTLQYIQTEGDGAFLSRIEDKGEVIQMESAVPETPESVRQAVQYIKQEVLNLKKEFEGAWGEIIEKEGHEGVRKRNEHIFGRELPEDYKLIEREFSKSAVLEIIKELRCRGVDGKLCSILRPVNGIIKAAEFEAIFDNSELVEPLHVRKALDEHLSLEGELSKEAIEHKKNLKKYISSLTDAIGYVVGLAVIQSGAGGQMYGQPLPIRCQVNAGGQDTMVAPGKIGDIAKAAAQNVRASIKRAFNKIGAPIVGYEMHVEYIQAHGGVEGDSASVAMDVGLISDYIKQPVNQKYGITGSLTGDIVLAVGGTTEKVRSIMDSEIGMEGACVPWQNRRDIEPLLLNIEFEYIQKDEIPGVRIFRMVDKKDPFDIYFCKTKYNVYKILMGLDRKDIEEKMVLRSKKDLDMIRGRSNSFNEPGK